MAETPEEFSQWMDDHPDAKLFVSEDVWTELLQPANTEFRIKILKRGVTLSRFLPAGMLTGFVDPLPKCPEILRIRTESYVKQDQAIRIRPSML